MCFVLFPLFDLYFVDFPSVLWYCWLGLLTCKKCLPYNLYCVGGDVKHCTIQSNPTGKQFSVEHVKSPNWKWLWGNKLVKLIWIDPIEIRAVPNILFVFYSVQIVSRIIYIRIRLNSYAKNTPNTSNSCHAASARFFLHKPRKQTLPWARHSKQLLLVCLSTGDSCPQVSSNH